MVFDLAMNVGVHGSLVAIRVTVCGQPAYITVKNVTDSSGLLSGRCRLVGTKHNNEVGIVYARIWVATGNLLAIDLFKQIKRGWLFAIRSIDDRRRLKR